ncbi:MAG: hypothetical protein KDC92_03490 [Bacteroidetes bacterium]|nr:hypothetical protein [Bacteroidota bacterium]
MKIHAFLTCLFFIILGEARSQTPHPYSIFGCEKDVLSTFSEKRHEKFVISTSDTLNEIQAIIFNSSTQKVEYVDKYGLIVRSDSLKPTLILRFLSKDRLADKYPSQSPYAYASNMPISAQDANGDSTYLIIYGAGYTNTRNIGGGHDNGMTFKLHAEALEKSIRNSENFDPKNDDVIIVYAPSTEQFVDATNITYESGSIKQLDVFSHGGAWGISLGGRQYSDPGSNDEIADADYDDYNRREINEQTVGQINFENFGKGAVCTFNGCSIGGDYSSNEEQRKNNAQESFGQLFSNTSSLKTLAFTGDAETQVIDGEFQYGTMIRSVDKSSQTQNYTVFKPNATSNPPAAVTIKQ